MNSTQLRLVSGKVSLLNPKKPVIRKKARLNQTLNENFSASYRSSTQSLNQSIDLPVLSRGRVSTSHSVSAKPEPAYNPIAQVQAIPLTPQVVLKQFGSYLSKFEVNEIADYKEINFLGMKANKIKSQSSDNNYGYDDERFDYKIVINDHIAYRYEILQVIGKGSFGQVCLCFDHKLKENIAIKIIRNQSRFHKQGRIETRILSTLKSSTASSHTVEMLNYFLFRKHICIVFELLGSNLYELQKLNNFRGFSSRFIQKISIQLMQCLSDLKLQKIIHCDLKPENILTRLGKKTEIKVIDFGASCFINEKIHAYIQSRFYRAPEIVLGINYTESIDVWSAGCILAELASGFPLFPAESEMELLVSIVEVKGLPDEALLDRAVKKKNFFEAGILKGLNGLKGKKRVPGSRPLDGILKGFDLKFVDFVESKEYLGCICWAPENRINPSQALEHPWINNVN